LALGEVVLSPRSAPPRCHYLGDATTDGLGEAMEKGLIGSKTQWKRIPSCARDHRRGWSWSSFRCGRCCIQTRTL